MLNSSAATRVYDLQRANPANPPKFKAEETAREGEVWGFLRQSKAQHPLKSIQS